MNLYQVNRLVDLTILLTIQVVITQILVFHNYQRKRRLILEKLKSQITMAGVKRIKNNLGKQMIRASQ